MTDGNSNKRNTPAFPTIGPQGNPVRVMERGDVRVEIALSQQKLRLDIPEPEEWRDRKVKPGDTVEVVVESARFQHRGDADIDGLPLGMKLGVSGSKDGAVRVGILLDGMPLYGWVKSVDVKLAHTSPILESNLTSITRSFAGRLEIKPDRSDFVSAAVLIQKAKQFDDGLYATIELLAQQGAGHFPGKAQMLAMLSAAMAKTDRTDAAKLTILGATQLGQPDIQYPTSLAGPVRNAIEDFQQDELRSKPIGFYTWSAQLERIFQQDRMLQTKIETPSDAVELAETLRANPESLATYVSYLNLVSRITNPMVCVNLSNLEVPKDRETAVRNLRGQEVAFFPPSRSYETDLSDRLGSRVLDDDFDLFPALIDAVRSGELSLKPSKDSGWYDHQVWSLEPLILPDETPESKSLVLEQKYREHLDRLFKGTLAMTRETHAKQLFSCVDLSISDELPIIIHVNPQISVEPLPTCYLRRAASYRFVREHLQATFGAEALHQVRRSTANGPVEMSLLEELKWIEDLFTGAAVTSALELGMVPEQLSADGLVVDREAMKSTATFLDWIANRNHDPDIGSDSRMMVPVSFNDRTGEIRVWLFLGWTTETLECSFEVEPHVQITAGEAEIEFDSTSKTLRSPVVVETKVTRLLNRDEFRQHCDTYFTRDAILKNLK